MRAVGVDCATRITVFIKANTENGQKLGAVSVSVSYSNEPLSLLATSLFLRRLTADWRHKVFGGGWWRLWRGEFGVNSAFTLK